MKITLSKDSPVNANVDLLVVGVSSKRPAQDPLVRKLDRAVGGALVTAMKDEEFKGKAGQTLRLPGSGRLKAKKLMLVGLGDGSPSAATLRLYAVKAARAAAEKGSLGLHALDGNEDTLAVLGEGVTTGAYKYTRYFTGARKPKKQLGRVAILVGGRPTAAQRRAIASGRALADSVNLARDLVNTPANDLTATNLADIAQAEAKEAGIGCKIYDKRAIKKLGMPLLLAVNQGSHEEPRFIHMTYKPKGVKKPPRVVFVGKGLTFDSGGLCLKPAAAMLDMKIDMAGSATTIGTVLAAARLRLPIEVHALVGSTDNMNGSNAYRPGDVFPSRNGKTVEIINTDAEGRLVLADALAFATELKPDYVIDHATLTGACLVALGAYRAAMFANDQELLADYRAAAERSGEDFWNLPLDDDLKDQLKSSIADLKHTGARYGGTITAALFLREFVGDCKWAHLDIAGPSYLERIHGIHPKGGTGFGVLTAIEFLRGLT